MSKNRTLHLDDRERPALSKKKKNERVERYGFPRKKDTAILSQYCVINVLPQIPLPPFPIIPKGIGGHLCSLYMLRKGILRILGEY